MLGHEDEGPHVEAFERELDMSVNFLPTEAITALGCLEAFEADNEDFGHAVQLQCLGCLHKLLALVAVPFVVLVKRL